MDLGLVVGSFVPPESLAAAAGQAEDAGFREIWIAEDFFLSGGISGAGIALGATRGIQVGIGVVSAVVRHPAVLAMEIATLARAHPGRFVPGIGLGVPSWIRQMGLLPSSPIKAMAECVGAIRRLLSGEELTEQGANYSFDRVRLTHVPTERVPIHMGPIGPKMLELSGAIADGSVLSVGGGIDYLLWARERIAAGRTAMGGRNHHRITAFSIYSVAEESRRAKDAARSTLSFYLSAGGVNALTNAAGISHQLADMLARGGEPTVAKEMPDRWVDELTIAGSPEEVTERIGLFGEHGADSIALFPTPASRTAELVELTARRVLPRISP